MAFTVTNIVKKGNPSYPDFDEWYKTILDPAIVYEKYPELKAQSIDSIVINESSFPKDITSGFIDEFTETTNTGSESFTKTTSTWESHEDFKAARQPKQQPGEISFTKYSSTVTGTNTYFSNLEVGSTIYAVYSYGEKQKILGEIASIESDTSLTLTANASVPGYWDIWMDNRGLDRKSSITLPYKSLRYTVSPLEFILDLYHQTYPVTEETTFANV